MSRYFDSKGIGSYDDPDVMAECAMRAARRGDHDVACMAVLLPGVLDKVMEKERQITLLTAGDHVIAYDNDWTVVRISTVEPRVYCKEGHPAKWGGKTSWFFTDEISVP